jgi:hypothetical protein
MDDIPAVTDEKNALTEDRNERPVGKIHNFHCKIL